MRLGRNHEQNARAETVAQLPTFRAAYAKRRCIVPVDCFFEWRAIKGARAKQPYAVAMKDRAPVRYRRPVGELASSAKRRLDSHLRYPDRSGERTGRGNSRPHAADIAESRLRALARTRARSARSACAVPGRSDDDVAGVDACEQARE